MPMGKIYLSAPRSTYKRKWGGARAGAGRKPKVSKVVKTYVKNALDADNEDKHLQTNSQITFDLATASVGQLLNGMVIGAANQQRLGREVKCKYLDIRGYLKRIADVTQSQQLLRLIIVWDRDNNGAATVASFKNAFDTIGGAASANPLSPPSLVTKGRFQVLLDRSFYIPNTVTTAALAGTAGADPQYSSPSQFFLHTRIKLDKKTLYNNNNVGDVSDINKGGLYIIAHCDATTNSYAFKYIADLIYEDS